MKLLVDMNLSPDWAAFFTDRNTEATHWSSIGPATAPDVAIFAWAHDHGHTVFTHDLDFGHILASSGRSKPSVVQIRFPNIDPQRHGPRFRDLILKFEAELEAGALMTIEPSSHRVRLLPLT